MITSYIITSKIHFVKPLDKMDLLWYPNYEILCLSRWQNIFCINTEEEVAVRIFQKGFNYSQDGPGNRLVYHLQGCNLNCPWCANPEGLALRGGTEYTVAALVYEVLSCKIMFFDGGGVTLTGGEVTMQFDDVKEFLNEIHPLGIHTCIETNGISSRLEELFPVLDYLIMDIKHYDANIHKSVIGIGNEKTVKNIQLAMTQGKQLALRIPLIGGFNATPEDAQNFCRLFASLGVNENTTLELLPYHEYGKDKYAALGIPYPMTEAAYISDETYRTFTQTLRNAGIRLIQT